MAETPIPETFSRLKTIRSAQSATDYINNTLGVPLAFHFVRAAAQRGELPNKKLGQALYFSPADIYAWVRSL